MSNSPRATKKQQELLEFVTGFIREHDYGPSYREIMRALDYKSVSTVAAHVEGLIAKGFLARKDKSARSLEVVGRMAKSEIVSESAIVEALNTKLKEAVLTADDKAAIERVKYLFTGSLQGPQNTVE